MPTPLRVPFGLVNAYLLRGAEGDVLVDTGLPGLSSRLFSALGRVGSAPNRLRLIVLTHVHLDHVGNLAGIRLLSQAPVMVHRLDAPLLQAGRVVLPAGQNLLARAVMGAGAPAARLMHFAPCEPDVVVDDCYSLQEFGLAGRVVHTPGHTAGSISVVMENGDAVVGDLCQNGWGFGMGLGPIVPPLADLPELLPASWGRLLREGARRFFPGHGRPFSAEELQAALTRKRRGA